MEEYIKRGISGKKYDYFSKDYVRILNLQQVDCYINEFGIVPVDVVISDDRKNPGKKVVLFVFKRDETYEAYDVWTRRGHQKEGDKIGTNS